MHACKYCTVLHKKHKILGKGNQGKLSQVLKLEGTSESLEAFAEMHISGSHFQRF